MRLKVAPELWLLVQPRNSPTKALSHLNFGEGIVNATCKGDVPLAPNATIYNFDITLSDMDRDIHAEFNIRPALHPSESLAYLLTRVLAYCLEYVPGITFTKGIADGDAPALWAHDATGRLTAWIEVGMPDAQRLHTAHKRVEHVAVYTHRNPMLLLEQLSGHRIHRAATIPIYALERRFLDELTALLERHMAWSLLVTERQLYLNIGTATLVSAVTVHYLPGT